MENNIIEKVKKFQTPASNLIGKEFFLDYTYPQEVSSKRYLKDRKSSKRKSVSTVTDYFKIWEKADFFETKKLPLKVSKGSKTKSGKKGKSYTPRKKHFRLNLEPYFEYLRNKNIDFDLSGKQQNYLSKRFNYILREEVYESKENLFQAIDQTIRKFIILRYTKNLFLSNQNKNFEIVIKYANEEEIIIKLINILCDELTQETIKNYLRLYLFNLVKARNFGNFSDHLAKIITKIEGKIQSIPKFGMFYMTQLGYFDITKCIVAIYYEAKSKNKKERERFLKEKIKIDVPIYSLESL